jgi:hypothetical protein
MVQLGKGQAILGGSSNGDYQKNIYFLTCFNKYCSFSLMDKELSGPRSSFVAIPIPDKMTGCITGGKYDFNQNVILENNEYKLETFCF